jgi:hypothetical protein
MACIEMFNTTLDYTVTSVTKRDKSRNVTGRDRRDKRDTPKGVMSRLSRHGLSHLSRRSLSRGSR